MAINKIIYGDRTLLDLTGDTATPDKVEKGLTFHDKSGNQVTGTSTLDSDTQDATASVAELLEGKTAYARRAKLTGTMKNNGSVAGEIDTKEGEYTVPQGFHDGAGKVRIAAAEKAKLIPANIRKGVTVLGVAGEMDGSENVKPQSKTATPKTVQQVISPDEGFNCLTSVTVEPIPYVESSNAAGGMTATIG